MNIKCMYEALPCTNGINSECVNHFTINDMYAYVRSLDLCLYFKRRVDINV